MLPLLEDEHAAPLAHDEAVAVGVEGSARSRGVGVRGECAAGGKARDDLGEDGRLGTAGQDGVGIAVLDGAEGLAHRMRRGRARGDHGQGRALGVVADGHVAGGHVRDHHRHKVRGGAAHALLGHHVHLVGVGLDATDARADVDAQTLVVDGTLGTEARVRHRLVGSRHRELHAPVEVPRLATPEVRLAVKALDLGGHLDREALRVEARDRPDAAAAREHRLPGRGCRVAQRRDGADAGDRHPVFHRHLPTEPNLAGPSLQRNPSYIAIPPSTRITSPVTYAAASLTRNRTTPATSSGSARRPRGIWPS